MGIASRVDCFSETPTSKFGEGLKDQVEERLKFVTSGTKPRKNKEAMQEVLDELKKEGLYYGKTIMVDKENRGDDDSEEEEAPKKKSKKDKKKKKEVASDEESEEPKKKEKKAKKDKKRKRSEVASDEEEPVEAKPKKKAKKA